MSMSDDSTPDISGMIKGIMQNPEFANLVKEMRGEGEKSSKDMQSEMMEKLPEIMSMLGPMMNGQSKLTDGKSNEDNIRREKSSADLGNLKLLKNFDKFDRTKATRLMSALKPYLSPERCGIIDKCMSVMQIGDVMTVLRGLDGINQNGN